MEDVVIQQDTEQSIGVTAPVHQTEVVERKREVAYVIKEPLFILTIYKLSGAGRPSWWLEDKSKLDRLIASLKSGHNIKNSCFYAGISYEQYNNFTDAYPEFRQIKEVCESNTSFKAMNSLQDGLGKNPMLSYKYLSERGDLNFETKKEPEKPLQPSPLVGVTVNAGIVDAGTITAAIREIAREVFSSSHGSGGADTNGPSPVVEGEQQE